MNSQYRKNLKAILEACKQYIDEQIGGGQEMILEVSSITGLTNANCQDLKCGDVVVENDNGSKTAYIVSVKTATTLSLSYVDSTNSKEVKYEVSNSAWAYDETVTTALGGGGGASTHLYMISFRLEAYYLHFITKTPSGLNGKALNDSVDNTQVVLTSAEQLALFNALFDCIHTNDTVGVPPKTADIRCSFAIPNNYYQSNANIGISTTSSSVNIDYKCVNDADSADYSLDMLVDSNGVSIASVGTSITEPIVICESQIL